MMSTAERDRGAKSAMTEAFEIAFFDLKLSD